jgi:radical SAM protein
MLYWEMTQACDLACRHCRAAAIPRRDPRELSTEEGFRLLDTITGFGDRLPHVVFTGGDPLRRPDLYELLEYGGKLGLQISVTPSGTPACSHEAIDRLKASGAYSLAFSLDGATPEAHDRIRGVEGSFERTVAAIGWALEAGIPIQVNTLVAAETAADFPNVYRLVTELGVQRWAPFFLIGVGRGAVLSEVSDVEAEAILEWLTECSRNPRPIIKTTEAHHYRRIALQRRREQPASDRREPAGRQSWGVRDGVGIIFVSHIGEVYPSGFLPLPVGNVRTDDLIQLYREAPLLQSLRDTDLLKGKCGWCEYRVVCGGSRARAFASSGYPLKSDPLCAYQPDPQRAHAATI